MIRKVAMALYIETHQAAVEAVYLGRTPRTRSEYEFLDWGTEECISCIVTHHRATDMYTSPIHPARGFMTSMALH